MIYLSILLRDCVTEKFWLLLSYWLGHWLVLFFNQKMTLGQCFIFPSFGWKRIGWFSLDCGEWKPYYSIGDLRQATDPWNCFCLWSVWLWFLLVKPSTIQMSNNSVAIFHLKINASLIRWSISHIHITTCPFMHFMWYEDLCSPITFLLKNLFI